jgi:PRONE (Plant-specific Rop nucleotide exchanger)
MATRPRSDIEMNLPALEKLDAMLLVSILLNYNLQKRRVWLFPLLFGQHFQGFIF